jgi:hypothetical protein
VNLPRAPPREIEDRIEVYSVSLSEKEALDSSDSFPALDASAGVESERPAIESDKGDEGRVDENVDGNGHENEAGMNETGEEEGSGETEDDSGSEDGNKSNEDVDEDSDGALTMTAGMVMRTPAWRTKRTRAMNRNIFTSPLTTERPAVPRAGFL